MKRNKFLSTLLAITVVIALLVSVTQMTVSATDGVDFFGNYIDTMMFEYVAAWLEEFEEHKQINVPPNSGYNIETYILIDSQLLEHDILDSLTTLLGASSSENGLKSLYVNGIHLLVHQYNYVFKDICEDAFNTNVYNDTTTGVYDFATDNDWYYFVSLIGQNNMCALGIWALESPVYDVFYPLQYYWKSLGDDYTLPVYLIFRDPVTLVENGLDIMLYNSNTEEFISGEAASDLSSNN